VTGTNGKTTTVYLLEAGLRAAGRPTGLVGTVETRIGDERVASVRTTPEATDLQALLAVMRERGVTAVALEVSSHALALGRVDGLVFDVAVFTNLTEDHLDFHRDMEDYFAAKASLFTPERARLGLANVDDEFGRRLLDEAVAFADAALAGRWPGVTPRLGPHAPDTCSPELLGRVAAAARERGIGLHTHLAQSRDEVLAVRARTGRSPVELLDELGLLGPDLVAAHLGFVTDDDVARLAASGTAWGHCPASNAKRGYLAPVGPLRAAGLRRGLGTDWLGYDMWEAVRWAIGVARLERGGADGLDARAALREATLGGAAILGLDPELGSLEPGKLADLIVVGLDRPWLEPPPVDPIAALAYNGSGRDVTAVAIGGRLLVVDGSIRSPLVDEAIAHGRRVAEAHRGALDRLRLG